MMISTPTNPTSKHIKGQGKMDILGTIWTIKIYPFENDDHGETLHDKAEIHLNSKKPPNMFYETMLHEIIHAVDLTCNLALTENQVHNLAVYLRAVLKSNPKFAKWVIK